MNNEEDRISRNTIRQRLVTWRGATLLFILFLWTCSFWYWGYEYGSGEPDRLQAEIDAATEKNELLTDLLDGANIELDKADIDLKNTIADWQQRHSKLKRNSVPASQCQGEDDYYGTEAAKEFAEELDRLKEGWLREND